MQYYNLNRFKEGIEYVVKPGDSLYKIANEYGLTINDLVNYNNLSQTMIYPNQIIFIPKNSNVNVREYITLNGDTINKILAANNMNLADLEKYNKVYDLELAPNQVIRINGNNDKYYTISDTDTINGILLNYKLTPLQLLELNRDIFLIPGTKIIVG